MVTIKELSSNTQTGEEMYNLVNQFSSDIDYFQLKKKPLSQIPFNEYFELIKKIPFSQDQYGVEIVTRPLHLLSTPWNGLDCKKKSILIASWLKENHIPFRFMAVSKRPDKEIHHVIVEARPGTDWIEIDATYPKNFMGMNHFWTVKQPLPINSPVNLSRSGKLVSMYGIGEPSKNTVIEFIHGVNKISPESMGVALTASAVVGIVAAIVGAVGAITGGIIAAVSNKRRQERQIAHDISIVESQQGIIASQAQAAAAATQTAEFTQSDFNKLLIPALIAAGIIFII